MVATPEQRPRLVAAATVRELARLERSHRASAARSHVEQTRRLRDAIATARRAPFWHGHLRPLGNLRRLSDLERVPPTDKPELREVDAASLLTAPVPPGTRTLETSGSTGIPFVVHYGPRAAWWQGVLRLHTSMHRGVRPWDRIATLSLALDERPRRGPAGALAESRRVWLRPSNTIEQNAQLLLQERPPFVGGHAHLLIELGHGLAGRFRPRGVFTHGETTSAEDRAELRELYGVEPIDSYGTAECGAIAWQCRESDLYHVNHDAVVLELVDDDGRPVEPGQQGHVLLTSLWNPLMPFVRYRIGDSATWATRDCSCGARRPALSSIAGRTFAWIVAADGARVAPQRMWASLHVGEEYTRHIRRYRVRQDESRRVVVDVVPVTELSDRIRTKWADSYRSLLGDVPIEINAVDQIETRPHEKFEIISSVASPVR
jgi:phenylacetate-CoA ligase